MRAAIYARVSTAKQAADDKVSLDDQQARCEAICAARGWEVVGVYDEGDASAGTTQRGEFQRLISDAKAGAFDVIVAREVSRLSRVAQARHAIESLMVDWGISVCNARTGLVYSESEGLGAGVIWTLEARLAEAELAEKSFRTTLGKNGKAAQGKYPSGRVPYGYRWSGGHRSEVIVDENKADVVRRIFELAAAGRTGPEIVDELTRAGFPTPAGGAGWGTSFVHSAIKNRAYIGEHRYGAVHYRKLNSERDRQAWARAYVERTGRSPRNIPPRVPEKRDDGDPNVYHLAVPAIVEESLFDRANRRIARVRKNQRQAAPKRRMLLQGLLRCDGCGRPMNISWAMKPTSAKAYYFYRCGTSTKDPGRLPCRATDWTAGRTAYVSADAVEGAVWRLIDGMLRNPATLASAIGERFERDTESSVDHEQVVARKQAQLGKLTASYDKARRAFYAGIVDDGTFARDRAHFETEIGMITEELGRIREADDARRRQRTDTDAILLLAKRWPEVAESMTDEERASFVGLLVADVSISPDDIVTITGNLSCATEVFGSPSARSQSGRRPSGRARAGRCLPRRVTL